MFVKTLPLVLHNEDKKAHGEITVTDYAKTMHQQLQQSYEQDLKKYQCTLSDYINRKRIDFSMELMRLEPNLTQDKIA